MEKIRQDGFANLAQIHTVLQKKKAIAWLKDGANAKHFHSVVDFRSNLDSQSLPSQFQKKKGYAKMNWRTWLTFTLGSEVAAQHKVDRQSVWKAPSQRF